MALLEARDLRKTYRLSRTNVIEALRGVDVTIDAGEMVAIMGPSGSGKSTLMHMLGLLHAPDGAGERPATARRTDRSGGSAPRMAVPAPTLRIDGRDMTALGDAERTRVRAAEMGFVFQSFNLVPTLTAAENVALAGEYAGLPGSRARAAAADALSLVGLSDRGSHRPSELSGGQQQRAAIARALVNRPRLILADEPTGNLDSHRAAEVLALMRQFNREQGQTFILVTHDPEVGAACNRIIRMRDGVIVADERGQADLAA